AELWEPWMREVDGILEDEDLLDAVFEAQGERHPESRRLGRHQTPAEVVLRILILKHVRNWSYETVAREVRANLVYRSFCRIGLEKVPDDKTLIRLGQAIGPEVVRQLHDRIVELAQVRRVPQLVTADAGYYAQTHERALQELGVPWVAVPNRSTRSAERKK